MLTKEPQETLDFGIEWADWTSLPLSASVWDVPAGITNVADNISGSKALIRLSGGTWTETYELANTITAGNESETRYLTIKIQRSVAYCSTSEVRRRATQASNLTTLPNAELESLIEQASRMFDTCCGLPAGYFNPPLYPMATEQVVYGEGGNFLKLPPYVPGSLSTSISLPDGYTPPSFVERDGYLVISSNGSLAHRIAPYSTFGRGGGWWGGLPVTITAKWGFEETPADVKMAVIELVVNLWRETDPAYIKLVNIEGQPLRERLPPRVAEIVKRYRSQQVAFV